jgi:hypothetical protein
MATEYEILDVWVGTFPTELRLTEYLAETYSDDDSVPISQFAADMGERSYNHDFVERSFHESSTSVLRSRLEPHSFSPSYAAAAATAFESASLPDFNTILLVWGEQFRHPVSVGRDDRWLHYLGRFDCDPAG